jgi:hypothetical protein
MMIAAYKKKARGKSPQYLQQFFVGLKPYANPKATTLRRAKSPAPSQKAKTLTFSATV